MKIKTITCQKVQNHGATLQAYALMHYLESLGNDVEIIDYIPAQFKHFRPFYCGTPKYAENPLLKLAYICVKFPGRLYSYIKYLTSKRKKNFEFFWNKYYNLTSSYGNFEQLKLNPPEADLYIAGSDQIWNTMMDNGKDPAYYLQFVPDGKRKATYAASFSVSEIPDELKKQIKKYIENINFVSVREKTALNILKDLGIDKGQVVLDPVFLLDKEQWNEIESNIVFDEKYLLVYDFEGAPAVENYAKKYADEHDLKIYSLYDNSYCDRSFYNSGPDVFLSLIKNAEFVVSNSFHATAFSIIYEKQFVVIERQEAINSRMLDLLNLFNIKSRMVINYVELNDIDYNLIKILIENQTIISKKYIKKVLEN